MSRRSTRRLSRRLSRRSRSSGGVITNEDVRRMDAQYQKVLEQQRDLNAQIVQLETMRQQMLQRQVSELGPRLEMEQGIHRQKRFVNQLTQ